MLSTASLIARRLAVCFGALIALGAGAADLPLAAAPGASDFVLARAGFAPPLVVDCDDPAVWRVAGDLAEDVARVTGTKPATIAARPAMQGEIVLLGILGHSALIDGLAQAGRLDTDKVAGLWESAVVQTVLHPWPGVDRALVIAGSDRRGAIYGAYWISESIGVSPWVWWADVPAQRHGTVVLAGGAHKLASPAVRYRGIFLNDEDWGLRPWAAHTLDPAVGNIGPATYQRIFELILRLRGNLLWPAMHPDTRAFNYYAVNKELADEFGIVMGSSHAEPMLRNNVDEWERDGVGEYNYQTNPTGVRQYWEQRVKANARFENIYTLGMRGIHDSEMAGGGTVEDRAARLRRIIADQRALLRRYVDTNVTHVPQLFCPYKEVMKIYNHEPSLIPGDVTLLWPDDNYGYIQHLASEDEQRRPGGSGVYYHISYWGRPYDYLWLCTTPPALIGEEMTKALQHGARQIWVVNVGDLKPAEWDTEFFLRLAWEPSAWRPEDGQHAFLRTVATRDFGAGCAEEIASILDEYYRLNFQRKPEHMGLDPESPWLAHPVFALDGRDNEVPRRLAEFATLKQKAEAVGAVIDKEHAAAFYELVLYPVSAAEAMNRKWLNFECGEAYAAQGRAEARLYLAAAAKAQADIDAETEVYNKSIAGGKWNGMMSSSPRDLAVFKLPATVPAVGGRPMAVSATIRSGREDIERPIDKWPERGAAPEFTTPTGHTGAFIERAGSVSMVAAQATSEHLGTRLSWRIVRGLGYAGEVLAAAPSVSHGQAAGEPEWGVCEYQVELTTPGEWTLSVRLLPTWPEDRRQPRRIVFAIDDGAPKAIALPTYRDENDERWQQDVLRNATVVSTTMRLTPGPHRLRLICGDPDILVDALLLLAPGAGEPAYTWGTDLR